MPKDQPPSSTAIDLDGLNEAQRQAVLHRDGPLLVVAGPGSGKTRVITHRVAHLVHTGVSPQSILAITFTNKAAREMRERILNLLGMTTPWISTFHSFSARLLRKHIYRLEPYTTDFSIYDTDDTLAVIKECIKELDISTNQISARQAQGEISRLKNKGIDDPQALPPGLELFDQFVRKVFCLYQRTMEANNALDFDDLLLLLEKLFKTQPDILERYRQQFQYVLIDEYQDTNQVQYRIGRLLADGHKNLCVTGDPDQSIYSWRGADITNILSFERDFPTAQVVKLEQNYRSTQSILEVANASIIHNEDRPDKNLWTQNGQGDPVRVYRFRSQEEEASEIADLVSRLVNSGYSPASIAIFYRINALSRELERAMVLSNIPYIVIGSVEFYLRKEIKDLLGYIRVLANPKDSENLKRIINTPSRRIGKATIEKLNRTAITEGIPLLEVIQNSKYRELAVSGSPQKQVALFSELFKEIQSFSEANKNSTFKILEHVVEKVKYLNFLEEFDPEGFLDRKENVSELLNAAKAYDQRAGDASTLGGFLEEIALLTGVDRWDPNQDRVSLMTLHSAKGLEFPIVIMAGVEDGLLPMIRSGADSNSDIDEERRLFYVGVTRAEKMLYLTHCQMRARYGSDMPSRPSEFLQEIESQEDEGFLELDQQTKTSLGMLNSDPWEDYIDPDPNVTSNSQYSNSTSETENKRFSLDDWDDDIVDEDPFPLGSTVSHEVYGPGEIVDSSGLGQRRKLTIIFESVGRKTIIVSHSKLKRI